MDLLNQHLLFLLILQSLLPVCVVLCVCSTFFGPFDDVPCEFQASMHADTIIYPDPSGSFDVVRSGLARLKFQLQAHLYNYVFNLNRTLVES